MSWWLQLFGKSTKQPRWTLRTLGDSRTEEGVFKTCPECHNKVVKPAVKCMHCGHDFVDENNVLHME